MKTRLELKHEQMTAWSAFEKAADEVSAKENAKCAALQEDRKTRPSFAGPLIYAGRHDEDASGVDPGGQAVDAGPLRRADARTER